MVYRAAWEEAGREVALKVIEEPNAERAEALLGAARRAQALAARGVNRVLDAGRDGELVWLVSELIPGRSLAVILEESGPLDSRAAVNVLVAVCRALEATHEAGLLHGDLKPGNVIIAPTGDVALTDIGVARSVGAGSVEYASPEASHGYPEDERSDLYSLGVLAYEILTGSPWTDGDDATVVLPDEVPPAVRSVVIRLLHKDQGARFRRASDVALALVLAAGEARRPPGPAGRRRRMVGFAVVAGLAIGAFWFVRGRGGDRHVVVNGAALAPAALSTYEERAGAHVPDGRYWYDRKTGAWGVEGGPPRCVTARGLDLGVSAASASVLVVGGGPPPACPLGQSPH